MTDGERTYAQVFPDVCRDVLSRGSALRFRATGRSMHPTIRDGENITVVAVPAARMAPGDIVLYRGETGMIAHRLIAIERRDGVMRFIMRGDSHDLPDEPVDGACIFGLVVAVDRSGRRVRLDSRAARLRHLARTAARRARSRIARLVPRS
jgi:hypothetical protein